MSGPCEKIDKSATARLTAELAEMRKKKLQKSAVGQSDAEDDAVQVDMKQKKDVVSLETQRGTESASNSCKVGTLNTN